MNHRRAALAASVCILAILAARPAAAQQVPPGAGSAVDQAPPEGQAGIADIIVTAQRRSESIQKSSVAIEVLSADALLNAGVTQARDLSTTTPGVQIGQAGAATQIYIRGVGDFGSTAGTNPGIAFNVDGVYVARPAGIEGNFYDVERVEVLKGPQGTLYGRNATGGAINLITAKPRLGVREMTANIEVGNYDKSALDAAVNLPVGDTLAIRGAFQLVHRGPYVNFNYGDDIHQSARLQALWQPDDRLSVRLSGDYTHIGGGGPEGVSLGAVPGVSDPWTSVTDPRVVDYFNQLAAKAGLCAPGFAVPVTFTGACPIIRLPIGPGGAAVPVQTVQLVRIPAGQTGRMNNEFWNISAQLDYDFGFATLTLLPAYRSASLDYTIYPGGFEYDISFGGEPETSKATSVEARLANDGSRLKWVAGLYYFNENQAGIGQVFAGFVQRTAPRQDLRTRNYAAFGQATFSLSDSLRVIGGLRYTSDRRRASIQSYQLDGGTGFRAAVGAGCVPAIVAPSTTLGCPAGDVRGDRTFKATNWKAGVEYDLGQQNMLYATAGTGFKAGGFYAGVAADRSGAGAYKPERLIAFEVGSRNRFLDNRLQINLDAFYYVYKDHQEPVIIRDGLGTVVQSQQNAGKGNVKGASADVVFKPSAADTLHLGAEYLDTEYTDFSFVSPVIAGSPLFYPPGSTGCAVTTGATAQTINCSGFPLSRAPRWTGMASYMRSFELGDRGRIEASGNIQFSASRYLSTDYLPRSLAPSYQLFNASLTYITADGALTVSAFIRNITNEAIFTSAQRSSFVPDFSSASIAPPRTFGLRLGVRL